MPENGEQVTIDELAVSNINIEKIQKLAGMKLTSLGGWDNTYLEKWSGGFSTETPGIKERISTLVELFTTVSDGVISEEVSKQTIMSLSN